MEPWSLANYQWSSMHPVMTHINIKPTHFIWSALKMFDYLLKQCLQPECPEKTKQPFHWEPLLSTHIHLVYNVSFVSSQVSHSLCCYSPGPAWRLYTYPHYHWQCVWPWLVAELYSYQFQATFIVCLHNSLLTWRYDNFSRADTMVSYYCVPYTRVYIKVLYMQSLEMHFALGRRWKERTSRNPGS